MKSGYVSVLMVVFAGLFMVLTGYVLAAESLRCDILAREIVIRFKSPSLDLLFSVVTLLGSALFLIPAYLILILIYIKRKKAKSAANIAAIGFIGTLFMFVLKEVFRRPRPAEAMAAHVAGFSYPSGHTFSAFVFFGLCVYLVSQNRLSFGKKLTVCLFLSSIAVLVGFSRVYLAVHYASDVAASVVLSITYLSVSLLAVRKIREHRRRGHGSL